MSEPVQWPAKPINDGGVDVREPLKSLLKALKLDKPPSEDGATPGVIESTTLEITNQVKKLITVAGGTAVIAGLGTTLWAALKDNTPLAIAIAAGTAFVLSAAILGLANIMDGDVRGRAAVTTEQVRARASVANAFLEEAAAIGRRQQKDAPQKAADTASQPPQLTAPASGTALDGNGRSVGVSSVRRIEPIEGGVRIHLDSEHILVITGAVVY